MECVPGGGTVTRFAISFPAIELGAGEEGTVSAPASRTCTLGDTWVCAIRVRREWWLGWLPAWVIGRFVDFRAPRPTIVHASRGVYFPGEIAFVCVRNVAAHRATIYVMQLAHDTAPHGVT